MALSIGIGCASIVWIATAFGLIPDPIVEKNDSRIKTTRTIALNVVTFAENRREVNLRKILERTCKTDPSIASIGVKQRGHSAFLFAFGNHQQNWDPEQKNDASKQVGVDILANGRPWGDLEIVFNPHTKSGSVLSIGFPFGLVLFVFAACSLFAWMVLARSLRYLNPTNVVPKRVRSALDTLTEGLVLLDDGGEIAHTNEAFCTIFSRSSQDLLGKRLELFPWKNTGSKKNSQMPWDRCLADYQQVTREIVYLELPGDEPKKFAVNATPIYGAKEVVRGVLVSFDDVTALENKNAELANIIGSLRSSRDEVARQNVRLNFLASYDPLTKCLNRRSFFVEFEKCWADENCQLLNLMILDVDNFKAVNDTHGHSAGDDVLVMMGALLQGAVGERGFVCRYGGEEFVVLIPGITIDQCETFANEIRCLIEQTSANDIQVTASIGISCKEFIPMDAQHLLDQADEALYIAKGAGRNRVVRFDQRAEIELAGMMAGTSDDDMSIPYSAVTGLLSALSFRSPKTAEHSIRVADMCVMVGEKLMNRRELFQLEVAALLHDIGKIGVPDSILLKPGPLNSEEWSIMRKHDYIGAEIVRSALSSEQVAHYIETHHEKFSVDEIVDTGKTIRIKPLAARIISVCDAYDSITHETSYRAAKSPEDALLELEENSPAQFDPDVVTILSQHIRSGQHQPKETLQRQVFSPRQATRIGQHIEQLCEAVVDEDVDKLKSVVDQLRIDALGNMQVTDAANRLDMAIDDSSEHDLDEVLRLANEVMQVCRDSRSTFVNAAESIVGSND